MTERSSGYYARIMGTFWRHPRTCGLSMAARGLWVSLLSWCADGRTDGEVPAHAVGLVSAGRPMAREVSELEAAGLLEREGATLRLRDWAQHNITREKHEKAKERARTGMSVTRNRQTTSAPGTRNSRGGDTKPSDQDQDQDQDQRSASADLSARASGPRSESVTQAAERTRATIAAAYRSRGLAVPRGVATLAVSTEVATTLAAIPADALEGILARFFGDRRMRERAYPVSYLLTNPNQWLVEGATGRDEGESRERPTETVLPEWLRTETHGGAA